MVKRRREIDPGTLVQTDQVHRDLYLDPDVFELEMHRLWRRSWLYAGHESEVRIAQVSSVRRLADRIVKLLFSDRGEARVVDAADGRTLRHVGHHGGFIFARLADDGPDLLTYLGDMADVLDTIVARSPIRRFEVVGAPLRTLVRANWKIYMENINDALHPVSTHVSASDAARLVADAIPSSGPPPMALQQLLPFAGGYEYFDTLGGQILANGHSLLGTRHSIHSGYTDVPGYADSLVRAFGESTARQVLAFSPQNAVIYPSVALKAHPQTLRVLRPLAVDRTLVEAWTFQPREAPAALGQRGALYNRLAFSPMSVVALDDLHLFSGIQDGLRARANPWISLHRGSRGTDSTEVSGTDEALMRHQYRAWQQAMG